MSGRCERRMDSGVTCVRGTRGCYVDHHAYERGQELMSIPGYEPWFGMVDMDGHRAGIILRGRIYIDGGAVPSIPVQDFVPDLSSGATRGLLLDQLRDVSGHADLSLVHHGQECGEHHCALDVPMGDGRDVIASAVGRTPLDAEIAALIAGARRYFRE